MALDDLLRYEEEPVKAPKPPMRFRPAVLIAVLICGLAASLLIEASLKTLGYAAPFVLIYAALLSLAGLYVLVREVGARPLPETMRSGLPPKREVLIVDDDGLGAAVKRWEMRLDWTGRQGERFATSVQAAIIEIVNERLRVEHGIDLRTEPARARDLLGPRLWKFVTEPVRRRMTGPELTALVSEMEEL